MEAGIVLLAVGLLAFIVLAPFFSGAVRWILGSSVITGLAVYALFAVTRATSEPPLLVAASAAASFQSGDLTSLRAAVRRAASGLPYSQVAVTSRARDAFARRLALEAGLSIDAVRALEQDLDGLKAKLHDDVLADFLYLASSEFDERYRWVQEAQDRGGFESAFAEVLDRMEAWR